MASLTARFRESALPAHANHTSHQEDQEIIRLCAKWRKQHEDWFPARFTVTVDGTARWLKNGVVETPDRLLFMISVNEAYLGHVGLFRFEFDDEDCEIDNIVRGEAGYPGLMGTPLPT